MERSLICEQMFFMCNALQVVDGILCGNPLKVKYLATAENGRQYLMLFRCRQDEYGIRRRLFQCFQKGIESRSAEHVHLIDNIYLVPALLRRKTYLVYKITD